MASQNKPLPRKRLIGLTLGLVLSIIVLNVDKKLWWPLELETINSRNVLSKDTVNRISTSHKIVTVLFDDRTQFLLRQKGLPIKDFEKRGRSLINTAIEKLEAVGVKSIGIDLNLNTPSEVAIDNKLAKTISKFKNIVIADSITSFPSSPRNIILKSAKEVGYGELYADYDRIVHKINLVDKANKDVPSFSYALFNVSTKTDVDEILKNKNEFYLRYQKNTLEKYSFIDLIKGEIKPELLKNKIVILGTGLKSKLINDQLLTPFERAPLISSSEVKATALGNLISKSYLFPFSLINGYPLLFVLLSMFLGVLFSTIPVIRSFIISSILFIGLVIFSQATYTQFNLIIELIPLLFLLLGNLVIGSLIFLQLDLQERNIELEDALFMLRKRSNELESSQIQLQNRNVQLSNTLSELNKRVEELKEVRKLLSNRSEEERKRIARELHDDTLARITDLKRHVESMLNSSDLNITAKKNLGASVQILDNVTYEIRRIINALRPSMLDNTLGLIPAIENLLDSLSKRSNYKIQTKLSTKLSKLRLLDLNEINLYRIVQEALNNILKHSNATKAEVVIEEQPGQILILVCDNGVGINLEQLKSADKKGFGHIDMKERAELIGATTQYLNKPDGSSTILEIAIPKDKIDVTEYQRDIQRSISTAAV